MNLGFKSKLMRSSEFAQIRYVVETYVESYVKSSVELKCKRRFEYVEVVPLFRYSTGLRALFRDDHVMMHPAMVTFPSLPTLLFLLPLPLSLASSALSKLSPFSFLSQVILTDISVPPLRLFA